MMNYTGMMNDAGGWMDSLVGAEIWIYSMTGILLAGLLVLAVIKLVKK